MFYHLSDADLNAIIAFLRSAPPSEGPATEVRIGPMGRLGLVIGQFNPQAATIDHAARPLGAEGASDPSQRGRYLALTICTECHGMDFQGDPGMGSTNLAAVAAYSEEDFAHLMRTGTALGGRTLGLMSEVALGRFVFLTDEEIHALYGYLKTLAPAPATTS
jgi:cytochrome c553